MSFGLSKIQNLSTLINSERVSVVEQLREERALEVVDRHRAERYADSLLDLLHPELADPKERDEDVGELKLHEWTGELFVDGVTGDDVRQGQVGTCYFLSALSAVADKDPHAFQNMIKDNGNGTYTVRFYDENKRPVHITVDSDLYYHVGRNRMQYSWSNDHGELWVSLIEKAYAQWKGGYEAIDGGNMMQAMEEITGRDTEFLSLGWLKMHEDEEIWAKLSAASHHGQPMTANTDWMTNDSGMVAKHVYTVMGTEEVDGERYVLVRNPWGFQEFESDEYTTDVDRDRDGALDGNDGVFRMKYDDFLKKFDGLSIGEKRPWISDFVVKSVSTARIFG